MLLSFGEINAMKFSLEVLHHESFQIDPTDPLPKKICHQCKASLCAAYAFGEKARLVEKELKLKYGEATDEDFLNVEYLQDEVPFEYLTYESDPVGLALEKLKDTAIVIKKVPPKEVPIERLQESKRMDGSPDSDEDCDKGEPARKYRKFEGEIVINLTGPVPCICMCCSKTFSSKEELLKHKDVCGEDSYICRKCCTICDSLAALKKHQQTHYDYKYKHKCPSCEQIFRNTFALDNHRSKDHGEDIEERGYVYRCCDKEFRTRKALHEHAEIHAEPPLECAVCGIKSKNKHTLRLHLRIHEDYRPYVCQDCGMAFRKKNMLFQHSQMHAGVQLLRCDFCPKQFGKKESLKNHCQRYHPSESMDFKGLKLGQTRKRIAQDHSYQGEVGREEEVKTVE